MNTLVIAEHNHLALKNATYHVLTAAQQLPGQIDILVLGNQCQQVVHEASRLTGVRTVLHADHPNFAHLLAENLTPAITQLARDYQYILAPSTAFGKNLLPRVAALLDVAPISDVIRIDSADTFIRPIYAGNVFATIQSHDSIKMLAIRPTAFAAAQPGTQTAPVQTLSIDAGSAATRFVRQTRNTSNRPELATADRVVAGGSAFGSAENFTRLLEPLAEKLNAAIGASRSAVDAGYAPNEYQVGQTGTIVAPQLYLAMGVSGAVQHLAGMKDSKVIVAVNIDPEAEIFQVADYGLVGDIFEVIPELTQTLTSSH